MREALAGWGFMLWCRVHAPRATSRGTDRGPPTHRISSTRISTSAVVPTHKTTRAALRIAMLQEAIDNAHCAGSGSEHHRHHGHTDGELAGLRVDVVHSRTLWPALEKGDSPRHRYSFAPIALSIPSAQQRANGRTPWRRIEVGRAIPPFDASNWTSKDSKCSMILTSFLSPESSINSPRLVPSLKSGPGAFSSPIAAS